MREVPYSEIATLLLERLEHGGAFLTSADGTHPNTMTIGWGSVSSMFGMGLCMVGVRTSRYTYGLIQRTGEYTVSIPLHDMRKELGFAGTASGADVNKFEGHGLTAAPAQAVQPPIVKECELHLECRVIGAVPFLPEQLSQEILDRWYLDRDMHTLFMGEIVKCYYTDA